MIDPEKFSTLLKTGDKELVCHSICDVAEDIFYDQGPDAIPAPLKTVFAVETFHGQVRNGGLEQYLTNGHESLAVYTVTALEKVGLELPAKVLRSVLELFPEEIKESKEPNYLDFLDEIEEQKGSEFIEETIEQEFWDWFHDGNSEVIRNKLYDWIVSNETRFTNEC